MNLTFVTDPLAHNMAGKKALALDACFEALRQLSDFFFHNASLNSSDLSSSHTYTSLRILSTGDLVFDVIHGLLLYCSKEERKPLIASFEL